MPFTTGRNKLKQGRSPGIIMTTLRIEGNLTLVVDRTAKTITAYGPYHKEQRTQSNDVANTQLVFRENTHEKDKTKVGVEPLPDPITGLEVDGTGNIVGVFPDVKHLAANSQSTVILLPGSNPELRSVNLEFSARLSAPNCTFENPKFNAVLRGSSSIAGPTITESSATIKLDHRACVVRYMPGSAEFRATGKGNNVHEMV